MKLKVAVIGVGYLGKFHSEKYKNNENSELYAVVDTNPDSEKIAKDLNCKFLTNYKDLFGKIDAASIVVPTPLHYKVAKDMLSNGIHLLIEKPFTETLSQADELIKIAEDKNLILQVGHLERFNPAILALEGINLNPKFIESHRISTYKERGSDVSVVLDLMIHDIDFILSIVQSLPKNIYASGASVVSKEIDIANARIEFENGCVANITASRISLKTERKLRIFQSNMYIAIDFAQKSIQIIEKTDQSVSLNPLNLNIKNLNFEQGDALNSEIKSFIYSVQNHQKPIVSGKEGRAALELALNVISQIKF